jgi:two-component system, NtrC family, sensor kinase
MKRRSSSGSIKPRRRKPAAPKRAGGTAAARPRKSSAANQEPEIARLNRELVEAREQQTATADVLKIISRSTFDLKTVLKTLVASAAQLCEADHGNIALPSADGTYQVEADYGYSAAFREELRRQKLKPGPGSIVGRTALSRSTVQILDAQTDPDYQLRKALKLGGYHTGLGVPLLREGNIVGVFGLTRNTVRPFTEKQIELVTTFAAQAVIAIENARLLGELRESLERQTATADVLRVISSSPGELEPVFNEILEKATRICRADYGSLLLCEGDAFRAVAQHNMPPEIIEKRRHEPLFRPGPASSLTRVAKSKEVVQIPDITTDQGYLEQNPERMALVKFGGYRSILTVPMLRHKELIGAFNIFRREVGLFNDKQIALAQNFAAQAVIAIENARLLNQLRESLDRQTATADILRVIAGTPEDSKRALDTIAETASRMFDSANVIFRRLERNVLRVVSAAGPSFAKLREVMPDAPLEPPMEPGVRCFLENRQITVEDRLATPPNQHGEIDRALHDLARRGLPIRSQAFTPLLREGKAIGVMIVSRGEVRSFQEHELELMRGFADQAVIAIENARLLSELRERTQQVEAQSREVVKLNQQLEQRVADQVGEIEPHGSVATFSAAASCRSDRRVWNRKAA